MATMIIVTEANNAIYVNADTIRIIREHPSGGSVIYFDRESTIGVKEAPADIVDQIDKAKP